MEDFFDVNIGLRSRFPLLTNFEDYNHNELLEMSIKLIELKGFKLSKNAHISLKKSFEDIYEESDSQSGNGRMVRNYIESLIRNQSIRIAEEDILNKSLGKVVLIDKAHLLLEYKNYNEIISALIKFLDKYKNKIVLVLSEEKNGIENLMLYNPSLNYRFPLWLNFENYSEIDLYEICVNIRYTVNDNKMYNEIEDKAENSIIIKKNICNNNLIDELLKLQNLLELNIIDSAEFKLLKYKIINYKN